MRVAVLVVGGLSTILGMAAVLAFREPPRPKERPAVRSSRPLAADEVLPSRREALGHAAPVAPALPTAVVDLSGARGVDPSHAQRNREAIGLLERGELERAVALFEQCVAAVPHEKVFQQNLAEALARLGSEEWDRGGTDKQAQAIERLARAAELAPDREDIQKRLEQMRQLLSSEEGNWTESSGHFDLSYDGAREDLAFRTTEIFDALEGGYLDLSEQFGLDPVAQGRARIRVVLYKKAGFHGATGIGHWAGGLYDGSIRVPVEDLGKERNVLRRVLRHELVHAFVHEAGGREVPGWLNEGLAQLLEHPDPAEHARSLDAARRKLRDAPLLTLEGMQGSLGSSGDDAAIARAYAQSLLFLDFVAREHGERVPFEMVAACRSGGGGPAAGFERRTGLALTVAFEDFRAASRR